MTSLPPASPGIGILRVLVGGVVVEILVFTYVIGIPRQGASLVDYFGYFTNLTSLLTAGVLIATGLLTIRRRSIPVPLTSARAVAVACMIVVGVVYNVLVPGTGSAPAWVSLALHTLFPVLLVFDWVLIGDRAPMPWRRLWLVLPYPVAWLGVVLLRGITDGWVPYGFLLPERGGMSLTLHVAGLVAALVASGSLVWTLSRVRSFGTPRRSKESDAHALAQPYRRASADATRP
ncbi:Pr6Pr family membrane protein [Microbacterium foliorum]|uniref:Pr6Pr family membrane protein n=1 Tax=Microbacterium sp. MEJ108Y TaxID=1587523 RepID=UPI0018CE77B5|nr:Pr6Pr family membrane protein [Microbacterium sp. MEJ108Y]